MKDQMPYVKCPYCGKSVNDFYGLPCNHAINSVGLIHFHKNVQRDCVDNGGCDIAKKHIIKLEKLDHGVKFDGSTLDEEVVYFKKKPRKKRKISKITGEKIYSRSQLEAGLWSVFSLFIRMRDKECLEGKMFGGCQGPLQAGHVIPRTKTATKYDEHNVFGQCAFHNKRHKWHPERYELWYMKTFGAEAFMKLKERSIQPAKKLNPKQLRELTTEYAKKLEGLRNS